MSRIAECALKTVEWNSVMTDPQLPSGSDRVLQAVQSAAEPLVLNVQGDEPLIRVAKMIDCIAGLYETKFELGRCHSRARDVGTASTCVSEYSKNCFGPKRAKPFILVGIQFPILAVNQKGKLTLVLNILVSTATAKTFFKRFCQQSPVDLWS